MKNQKARMAQLVLSTVFDFAGGLLLGASRGTVKSAPPVIVEKLIDQEFYFSEETHNTWAAEATWPKNKIVLDMRFGVWSFKTWDPFNQTFQMHFSIGDARAALQKSLNYCKGGRK